MNSTATRKAELFARTSTETLINSLTIMDSATRLDEHERMVYAWTCDEIEARRPEATDYILAAMDDLDDERTYGQLIHAALGL